VKKEADNKESEKNEKNDPSQQLLRNDIHSSSSSSNIIEMTNDMMMMPPPMPPPKPQELPAPAVVEPTKCIEPTNEEMKESKEHATTMEENEERESAPEKCTDDLGSAVQQLPAPPPRLCRPIQKARTAYFIFADEKRAEIAARVSTNSLACHFLHGTSWSLLLTHVSCHYYYDYCSTREKEWVPSHERLVKCGLP
jgi:hypothetical protein